MKISEIKKHLSTAETIAFELPDGKLVPAHFHVTEVGVVSKDFIDCGGKRRQEVVANFQLWEADDYDHRFHPEKLINIIELSQKTLEMGDLPIEVEYQGVTIGKFGLEHNGQHFLLTSKQTACLANEACGIPDKKPRIKLSDLTLAKANNNACTPGGNCC